MYGTLVVRGSQFVVDGSSSRYGLNSEFLRSSFWKRANELCSAFFVAREVPRSEFLLVPQRLRRIEFGRLARRINRRDETNQHGGEHDHYEIVELSVNDPARRSPPGRLSPPRSCRRRR